jgi:hypothetical protein
MGSYLIKHPDHIRRAQRLSLFCKEVKRAIINLCLDQGVPTRNVDFFMEDFFMNMEYHDLEYPIEVLLEMLLDDDFIYQAFDRYSTKA